MPKAPFDQGLFLTHFNRGQELHEKLIRSYLENNREVEKLKTLMKKLSK